MTINKPENKINSTQSVATDRSHHNHFASGLYSTITAPLCLLSSPLNKRNTDLTCYFRQTNSQEINAQCESWQCGKAECSCCDEEVMQQTGANVFHCLRRFSATRLRRLNINNYTARQKRGDVARRLLLASAREPVVASDDVTMQMSKTPRAQKRLNCCQRRCASVIFLQKPQSETPNKTV